MSKSLTWLSDAEWSRIEPLIVEHLCGHGVAVTMYDFE